MCSWWLCGTKYYELTSCNVAWGVSLTAKAARNLTVASGKGKKKNLDRKKKYLLENKWISRTSKLQVAKFHYPLFSRGIAEEIYTCWKHPPSLQHISKSQLTCNTGKDAPGSKSVSRSALLHDIGTPQVALGSQLCTPTFWTPCIAQQTCHLSLHQAASLGFATVGLTHCFFPADCGYWE